MDNLVNKVARRIMVPCRNSRDFECPYLKTCPHEEKDICQWQLETAKELIPLVAEEIKKGLEEHYPFFENYAMAVWWHDFWEQLKGNKR